MLSLAGPLVALVFLTGGAALAYWLTTDSSHPAAAEAATIAAPTNGSETAATPGSVTISWTAPAGYTPTSYTVSRCLGGSCTPVTAITSGGCSGEITTTTCTDTDGDLAPGKTYSYAVTAVLYNWVSSPSTAFQGSTTPASQLGFTVQPGHGANIQAAGTGTFTVTVAIEDSDGNPVTTDNSDDVTLAIGSNPGSGVLSCTNTGGLTVQAVAGLARFSGCSITAAGTGYTLTASSNATPTLTAPANANSFNIVAGAPAQLAFTSQPAMGQNIQAAGTGTFGVDVAVEDSDGNTVTSDNSDDVTLAIASNPSSGVLSCTNAGDLTVQAGAGVADFTGCSITTAGTGYVLTASSSTSPTLTAPTNANSFNIVAGAPEQIVFTAQPFTGQDIQATGTGTFPVAVAIEDSDGNTVTSDNSDDVTLAIASNPSSGVLSCTNAGDLTVQVVAGLASFTGCSITEAGTGYTLTASSSTSPTLTAPANANSFNIVAGAPAALAFSSQPGAGTTVTGTFAVSVAIEDSDGNTVTSDNSDDVTLAIGSNPDDGVLSCTNPGDLTVQAVAGLASFTGCSITEAGTGYTLTASSSTTPALTAPANANSFDIGGS